MTEAICACGAPMSRKAPRCRPCANILTSEAQRRPMPEDFATFAPGKTLVTLKKHYHASHILIIRWRKECGISAKPRVAPVNALRPMPDGFALSASALTMKGLRERFGASEPLIKRWLSEAGVQARKASSRHWKQPKAAPVIDYRENSLAGKAAQYLQKFGPVIRCDEHGKPEGKHTHWLRGGRAILTDDEIIERARNLKWNPDAWKALAA